jgi:hypothetical protein
MTDMSSGAQKRSIEICDHTYLRKDQCNHCLGGPPRLSPHYQLKFGWYQGSQVVEVLKDGGPVHPYDQHFRFGAQKARLLLTAIEVIKEFAANTDEVGNTTVKSQFVNDASGAILQIWIEMHVEFVKSTGEKIERPWLQIRRLPDGPHIGAGVQKAKAISALARELREWVEHS